MSAFYHTYMACLRFDIEEEIENQPEVIKRLGRYRNEFIKWCTSQRYQYEADLEDELNEFEEKYIKSRIYNTDVKLWKKISKFIFERDNYTCSYCGARNGNLEVDHIVPISRGGTNEIENLTTSCRTCNRQKRDKSVEDFLKWKEEKGL